MGIVVIFLVAAVIVCTIASVSGKGIVEITLCVLGRLLVLTIKTEKRDSGATSPRNPLPR